MVIIHIRFPLRIHNLFVDKIMVIIHIRFPLRIHNLFVDKIMVIIQIRFLTNPFYVT